MTFNLNDPTYLDHDLVARLCHNADAGAVTHDTDVSYLVRDGGPFSGKDAVSEQEIIDLLEKEGQIHGTAVYFVRWEEPNEWSML